MFDYLIKNIDILDGSGFSFIRGDVAVKDGRIAAVGDVCGDAECVLNGRGLVASPGFIDIHSHTDVDILIDPRAESKITQGVTLELSGNCGFSSAPVFDEESRLELDAWRECHNIKENWVTMAEMLSVIAKRGVGINFATLVGHSNLRSAVVGLADREASPKEIDEMKLLARQAMEEGAFGISSGLIYPPCCFADTEELAAVASSVAPYGGFYSSHIRSERNEIIEAVDEAMQIGKAAGVPVQISHHKACGRNNWGKVKVTLAMIREARQAGMDVTADQYPYTAGATTLAILLPKWAHDGGDRALLERIKNQREVLLKELRDAVADGGWIANDGGWASVIISGVCTDKNRCCEGKSLPEIAEMKGTSPEDVVLDLLEDEELNVGMVHFAQCEEDISVVMKSDAVMVGTDASARSTTGELSEGKPHPRSFGTFPRILGRYVREQKVIPIELAIKKMTSMPAQKLGLYDRGLLKPGFWADIVVFDPAEIIDMATYENPHQNSKGISYVFVNGRMAVDHGEIKKTLAGQVLRRNLPAAGLV